ncbi:TetR/AcrR family transcriptional regulator [Methylomonas koyamae]|uniref:TetR family transcriptional regulator n=1 Tax=Methylomonas koyamae TaxID=702114 RepID=A0A177NNY6_9GAMM|nr:TetR/AcrR family transcriptional regulator [Methylomonas koyamae]OAI19053.1 TetR family transcriptional regulator [Methylomonas koyamae]
METRNIKFKKDKILDCGVQLLMEKGYHSSGLNEILGAAKIPKGSFYYYFDSKEQFAVEVIWHYIEPFITRLATELSVHQNDGLQALKSYYAGLINEVESTNFKGGCLLGNLIGEIGDTSEACRKALLDAISRYTNLQQEALLRGQNHGSVRTDRSAKSMADLLSNSWQGALLRMKVEQSIEPLNAVFKDLLDDYFKA